MALALGLFLIFIARPLAVWICLLPFNMPRQETAFVSWVGLRGAVSILLAITPVLGGLDNGREIFNIAFIVVLVSLVVQGWTVGPLARRLGLIVPSRLGPLQKVELELPGSAHHELLAYTVVAGSPVARGQRIPRWARPSLVVRDGRSTKFQDAGRLMAGDHVYIFVPDRYPRLLDRLFASRTEVDPEDAEFFGAFAVDPSRPASDLESAYAPGLTEDEQTTDHRRADAGAARRARGICRPGDARADRTDRARCRREGPRRRRSASRSTPRRRRASCRCSWAPAKSAIGCAFCFQGAGREPSTGAAGGRCPRQMPCPDEKSQDSYNSRGFDADA